MVAAFRTSIYGASWNRFGAIRFHTGDVAHMILDLQNPGATLMMAMSSRAAAST